MPRSLISMLPLLLTATLFQGPGPSPRFAEALERERDGARLLPPPPADPVQRGTPPSSRGAAAVRGRMPVYRGEHDHVDRDSAYAGADARGSEPVYRGAVNSNIRQPAYVRGSNSGGSAAGYRGSSDAIGAAPVYSEGDTRGRAPEYSADGSSGGRSGGYEGGAEVVEGSDSDRTLIELTVPSVVAPFRVDEYVCGSWQLPDDENYIVGMDAIAPGEGAVYMMLYGCTLPAEQTSIWRNCRRACDKESVPLYAWARHGTHVTLPPDTGYAIGGMTGLVYLVLQVHYRQTTEVQPASGFRMAATALRPRYLVGLFVMALDNLAIPAGVKRVHGDVTCRYDDEAELHPFAFRVHAHDLGRVSVGYQVDTNGSYHLLGRGNPQWPQAYYPTVELRTIRKGDGLVTRCTYDSSGETLGSKIGVTQRDEMCNLYLLYYTNASSLAVPFYSCTGNNHPALLKTIPADSDSLLPPNPRLEQTGGENRPQAPLVVAPPVSERYRAPSGGGAPRRLGYDDNRRGGYNRGLINRGDDGEFQTYDGNSGGISDYRQPRYRGGMGRNYGGALDVEGGQGSDENYNSAPEPAADYYEVTNQRTRERGRGPAAKLIDESYGRIPGESRRMTSSNGAPGSKVIQNAAANQRPGSTAIQNPSSAVVNRNANPAAKVKPQAVKQLVIGATSATILTNGRQSPALQRHSTVVAPSNKLLLPPNDTPIKGAQAPLQPISLRHAGQGAGPEAETSDFGASLVIVSILVVPVCIIICATIILRVRKHGRMAHNRRHGGPVATLVGSLLAPGGRPGLATKDRMGAGGGGTCREDGRGVGELEQLRGRSNGAMTHSDDSEDLEEFSLTPHQRA